MTGGNRHSSSIWGGRPNDSFLGRSLGLMFVKDRGLLESAFIQCLALPKNAFALAKPKKRHRRDDEGEGKIKGASYHDPRGLQGIEGSPRDYIEKDQDYGEGVGSSGLWVG